MACVGRYTRFGGSCSFEIRIVKALADPNYTDIVSLMEVRIESGLKLFLLIYFTIVRGELPLP